MIELERFRQAVSERDRLWKLYQLRINLLKERLKEAR